MGEQAQREARHIALCACLAAPCLTSCAPAPISVPLDPTDVVNCVVSGQRTWVKQSECDRGPEVEPASSPAYNTPLGATIAQKPPAATEPTREPTRETPNPNGGAVGALTGAAKGAGACAAPAIMGS